MPPPLDVPSDFNNEMQQSATIQNPLRVVGVINNNNEESFLD